jgi:hypothetical protein
LFPTCTKQGFRGSFAETGTRSGNDHNPEKNGKPPLGVDGNWGAAARKHHQLWIYVDFGGNKTENLQAFLL